MVARAGGLNAAVWLAREGGRREELGEGGRGGWREEELRAAAEWGAQGGDCGQRYAAGYIHFAEWQDFH